MGFIDKHNDAAGRDPEFGAIFMSNSGTKRECFKRRLFGLPSTEIQFVEKVKAGMILFLFEYEKRLLHGVFKATCDGCINIVPNAFTSTGKQFPAQVKFIPIWFCKPLPENKFRNSIRENYFSDKKFNFGLSENQVYKLLHLFSMGKLELEVRGRHLIRTEDLKSEWYSVGKVGRSFGREMLVESVQNEQVVGDNSSPVLMHKYNGDSSQYDEKDEYIGLNADDIVVNKQGRSAELEVDITSGYVSDYLQLKDESRFTACENENYINSHAARLTVDTRSGYVSDYLALKDESRFPAHENKAYTDTSPSPYLIDGYSNFLSDKIRVHGDGRSSISDRLMGEDLRETDQRMVFSDDITGFRDSNGNPSVFYRKPILERISLAQNHLTPTSATIHPLQAQILEPSCATQGDASSILYNPDAPGLNFRQLSSVGINNGSESIRESTSPSTNCRRSSLSREPCLMHTERKDMNRWLDIGSGFPNSVLYGSNRDCMPFNKARNSDQLASESFLYEAGNSTPSLKSSSPPIPSDIGNGGRVHEPFSSFFYNRKSCLGNDVHPMALRENLNHEITLQKNNETFSPNVPRAYEGHSQIQYDDSLDHGYDIGCYGDSRNNNCSHPKKKSSVFSRLSFMQDVNKQENGNNAQNEEYGFHTSVAEVMEMVRQNHNYWMTKRKPRPSQRNKAESLRDETPKPSQRNKAESLRDKTPRPSQHYKAESLRDKTQIITSRMKNKAESLIDKSPRPSQRNKAESLRDKTQIITSRMKNKAESLIDKTPRPSQRSKAESLRDKTQIITSRMKGDCFENTLEDLNMDFTTATGGNSKTTAKEICFVDFKRRSKLRKRSDEIERSSNDSKKSENSVLVQQKRRKLIRPNFNKSTSSDDKGIDLGASQNLQVPLPHGGHNLEDVSESCCTLVQTEFNVKTDAGVGEKANDDVLPASNDGYICNGGGEKANEDTLPAANDGPKCVENINHHNVWSSTCKEESCHTKEGSCMKDNIKPVSPETESLHSICEEHNADKIKCADRGINTDEEMPKIFGSFSIEVKDGSEYLENSVNEKASIETSCQIKEGLRVMHSLESASPGTQSLHSTFQEHHLDKTICAGRGIDTEKGISKDGSISFTTDVKEGSDSSQCSGNDNAPIATCEQKMA